MTTDRRRVLRAAGIAIAGTALAGCVSAPTRRTDTGGDGGDTPRVDTPPYDITEPECDSSGDGRDPLWLCENMATDPSLRFDQVETSGAVLNGEGLQAGFGGTGAQFYAALLTDDDDLDRLDRRDSGVAALVEGTEFGSEALLVAQTGWGSGSRTPHLERVEATEEGVHAFGCYRRPCVWTSDYTARSVVARFERPDSLSAAVVSLTVDAETRVTFAARDGVVTVE